MESNNNEEKFIRTANGVRKKLFYDSMVYNEGKFNLCLPYEHICQNLGDFLIKNDQVKENESITLKNLSQFSLNPFSSHKNLFLENDPTISADELNNLKEFNCNLIVDATNQKNGQNLKVLREVSKISGIDVCFGYTLKEDFYLSNGNFGLEEKIHNEIRYDLTYGYDDMIPSFLGEFILSENFPDDKERILFKILIKIVLEFNIPLFIKLNYNSFNSENIFEYFEKLISEVKPISTSSFDKKLLVFIYSNYNCCFSDSENIALNILKKGFSLIYGFYELDLVLIKKLSNGNNASPIRITPYFLKEKLEFIVDLIKYENKKYVQQIMLSNNVNFKVQLKNFGGFGYSNIFINYFNKVIELANLNMEETKYMFSDNLCNLFSWWSPPKKEEKRKKMVTCSSCKNEKEESEDIFRKFDQTFCSVRCLREFSKN